MQFVIHSKFSRLLELLYTVKDNIKKGINTKKWKEVSLLDLRNKSE
jgi:hypothetical protein